MAPAVQCTVRRSGHLDEPSATQGGYIGPPSTTTAALAAIMSMILGSAYGMGTTSRHIACSNSHHSAAETHGPVEGLCPNIWQQAATC